MMTKAYIIDDELRAGQLLKAKIESITDYFDVVTAFNNPHQAYRAIIENAPDIIFADIEMPQMNGIEVLEKIKHLNIPMVYVTAFSYYSITAIKQQVFDYILKPVKEQELLETINKFIAWKQVQSVSTVQFRPSLSDIIAKQNSKISIHTVESINLISINTITQVTGEENYSNFMFQDGKKLLSSRTLKYFEQQLVPFGFIRVHKSHLVNMVFVDKLITRDSGYLQLRSTELIPFSRDKKSEILEWFKL
ncbi:LytTR family DNA-binding domain-containing protein [Dyadobacter sp. CY312]|uniref:LytR/AlgR family response regulator transcription factor n=1 Tax=Dyadobacter sp. CY312 TaxID=2907303 RepID=UPI001F23CEE8|nr:LytTR family DNA-binding domain-containing protein [Dyadobacter sp. CY312]MCE7040434.1 LytTR family DNA-binding domain-containing protein [Dyadobacter sp. CY312]